MECGGTGCTPREGGTHVPEEVEGQLLCLLLAADFRFLVLTNTHSLAQLISKGQLQLVLANVLLHLHLGFISVVSLLVLLG